jgi:hypothetical protein
MKFGIHNSSWLDAPDPAEAFEGVKTKAQWAENHEFVWFSVMDQMIQIPRVGAPDESVLEGWTVLSALAAVTSRIRLATPATSVGYRNPATPGQDCRQRRPDQPRAADIRHRRRLSRDRIPPIWLGISRPPGGAHPANGGSSPADPHNVDGESEPPFTAGISMSRVWA